RGVEATRECDADTLADRKRAQDLGHPSSLGRAQHLAERLGPAGSAAFRAPRRYHEGMADQRRTPGSQTSLREANRGRIVDAVKKHGGLTQVELAGATGLSPATVSNIVKELSESGVLSTAKSMRSGRRAQYVTLAHASGLVCGIHFSQRQLRVALA